MNLPASTTELGSALSLASALRARRIVAHSGVTHRAPPAGGDGAELPTDLAALYAASDGLTLRDGTRILPRAEVAPATTWLSTSRALDLPNDLLVVGERVELVLVRDLDRDGERAGGGLVEAPNDGLRSFERAAMDVLGYLEHRLGLEGDEAQASPEVLASRAMDARSRSALASALSRPFYPGSDALRARAWVLAGELAIEASLEDEARVAFDEAVSTRVRAAPRGAAELEARAALRACAIAAERAGAGELALSLRERAKRT